jgi:FMN-dependent NADH-azoreductase
MANILLITSSPRGSESYSNRIADTVIRDLRNNDPDALLMVRDLAQDPLPHVDDDFVDGRDRKPRDNRRSWPNRTS